MREEMKMFKLEHNIAEYEVSHATNCKNKAARRLLRIALNYFAEVCEVWDVRRQDSLWTSPVKGNAA